MLKRPYCILNYQRVRSTPCSLMGSVKLWESFGGGRLLNGDQHDELQKLLKHKVNQADLQN